MGGCTGGLSTLSNQALLSYPVLTVLAGASGGDTAVARLALANLTGLALAALSPSCDKYSRNSAVRSGLLFTSAQHNQVKHVRQQPLFATVSVINYYQMITRTNTEVLVDPCRRNL